MRLNTDDFSKNLWLHIKPCVVQCNQNINEEAGPSIWLCPQALTGLAADYEERAGACLHVTGTENHGVQFSWSWELRWFAKRWVTCCYSGGLLVASLGLFAGISIVRQAAEKKSNRVQCALVQCPSAALHGVQDLRRTSNQGTLDPLQFSSAP
jgi:hypothetical protein